MPAANGQPSDAARARASFYDRTLPASAAGMIGAVAAIAVSLPLRSPDDLFANAASVAVVSVIGAAVLGIVWAFLDRFAPAKQPITWIAFTVTAFAVTVIAAVVVERMEDLSNVSSFTAPLAGVMLGITTIGAPLMHKYVVAPRLRYVVPVLGVALVVAGMLLTVNEVGFNEPPSLALPPPP